MRSSFENKLSRYYPALFPVTGRAETDARIVRVRCGAGWFLLVETLCGEIQKLVDDRDLPQVTIVEIKEKFGLMRVGCQSVSEPVRALIETAQNASGRVCEACGAIGITQRTKHGWIKTLCVLCAAAAPT